MCSLQSSGRTPHCRLHSSDGDTGTKNDLFPLPGPAPSGTCGACGWPGPVSGGWICTPTVGSAVTACGNQAAVSLLRNVTARLPGWHQRTLGPGPLPSSWSWGRAGEDSNKRWSTGSLGHKVPELWGSWAVGSLSREVLGLRGAASMWHHSGPGHP